jgi:NAD+ synthase
MESTSVVSRENADKIVEWIREYAGKAHCSSLVVGVSGGIDSALVSTLSCMTGLHTYLLTMPIHQDHRQVSRAENHIKWLKSKFSNCEHMEVDLTGTFEGFSALFPDAFKTELSSANTRSRLRMVTLYQVAGARNGLVVGTGNKVEDFGVGFYTKYGDGGVDISPIADLMKSQVRAMAKLLGVNEDIIVAKPTDGLWGDDRSDEDQIGASYDELEWAMDHMQHKGHDAASDGLTERQKEVLAIYNRFNTRNAHKMNPIPVFQFN